ncbi:hypothetical protein RBE51_18250 [Pseudomonas taiwanensis]|uniref:hypothetical protein n=1 Tax=Pseudomonas taiwanensis TaxID=470150 RepID=UPI0028DFE590|nr:hypothetical protein [Pseudomonas taiwanensis]MDT8924738.1 hypothetical protein [Pseudomonas taiwanensis]
MTTLPQAIHQPKIRPKRTHQQLFGMLGVTHHTVKYCVEHDQINHLDMLAQVDSSFTLKDSHPFRYGALSEQLNQVAEQFGCWTTACPPILAQAQFDGKVAYLVVLTMIDRAVIQFDTKQQLLQLVEPIHRLFEALEPYGCPEPGRSLSSERLAKWFVQSAAISYRNNARCTGSLDKLKAEKQAAKSCDRLLTEGMFATLPPIIQETLYERVVFKMGRQHADTQARSREQSGVEPV